MLYAIYFEYYDDDDVRQFLFLPALNVGTKTLPPTLATRDLTPETPSRVWSFVTNDSYSPTDVESDTHGQQLLREIEQFDTASHSLMSTFRATAQWEYRGAVVLPLTDTDLADLAQSHGSRMKLPIGVQSRISASREKHYFPPLPRRD